MDLVNPDGPYLSWVRFVKKVIIRCGEQCEPMGIGNRPHVLGMLNVLISHIALL